MTARSPGAERERAERSANLAQDVGDKAVAIVPSGSGSDGSSDISAARAAGFDEHVIKPAELAKLERILASRKPSVTG